MGGTFNPGGLNTPPTSIVNFFSTTGAADKLVTPRSKQTLSGALTAATYKEILAVTDSGVIDVCGVYTVDATSRTIGLKIVIDGVTVFDAITAACTTTNGSIYGIGSIEYTTTTGDLHLIPQPKVFNSSLSVLVKSSLTETDKIGLNYSYHTT